MSNTLCNVVEQHDKVSGAKLGLIFKRQLHFLESIPIWPPAFFFALLSCLRKIGPEIRAHNLSCQLQFFGAFTKGQKSDSFSVNRNEKHSGIFFLEYFTQWNIIPIVSIKAHHFSQPRKTVGNEILTSWQKGSSKLLWDSCLYLCRPPH